MKLLFKTTAAALIALSSLSAAPLSSAPWRHIPMRSNLPGNTIAIAASPESQNFLAVASDETGGNDYSIFGLDHNQLDQGWNKVAALSLPGSVNDLIFGNHNFFVTGAGDRGAFVAVSSDSVNWDITASKGATPFIGVGSNEEDHTAYLFPLNSAESAEYVTIGDSHFCQGAAHRHSYFCNQPRLAKKFTAMTANNNTFIGIAVASDGQESDAGVTVTYSKSK